MILSALPLPLCCKGSFVAWVCASISLALKGYKFAKICKCFHVTFSRFNGEIKHIFSQHSAFVSFTKNSLFHLKLTLICFRSWPLIRGLWIKSNLFGSKLFLVCCVIKMLSRHFYLISCALIECSSTFKGIVLNCSVNFRQLELTY